jgi:hypothetical protein
VFAPVLKARALSLLLLLALPGLWRCEFEPKARRAQPRLIAAGAFRVMRSLEPSGTYVLVRDERDGKSRTAIYDWQRNERCDLPAALERVGRPLARPPGAPRKSAALWLPLVIREQERELLSLVDEHCAPHGPNSPVEPDSLRTFTSQEDLRGLLVFQDGFDTLLLDPFRLKGPTVLGGPAQDVQAAPPIGGRKQDALWLLEDGLLTQRSLSGELRVVLGEQVSAFALALDAARVAYVDGDTLFEAIGPAFEPQALAQDACLPRYGASVLDFFSPCSARSLRRRELASGELESFGAGVFASLTLEGVRLDYAQKDELTVELFAESKRYGRRRVEPPLEPQRTYVLDERRIAGLSADGSFGSWDGVEGRFREALAGVESVLPHYRGKTHEHWWLVHHDVEDDLGTLSVLSEGELRPRQLAAGVPAQRSGGFVMVRGGGLPNYPFAEPIVLLIEQAVPLAAEPERFKGRLRALLLSGEPSAELAADVSSYQLVAVPVPGVLYGVEEGAAQGLWFVGL